MELDKYFRNFKEYLAATHGGARVIYWQELTSEAEYIGSLKDGHIIHHVFHTKYCGAIQFVEFLEEISGMKEPPKSANQVLKQNNRGEWQVTSQLINGKRIYQVYRIINTARIDHCGNREYYERVWNDEEDAEALAYELNKDAD